MKNKSKSKSSAVPKVDPYLEGLMGKLLERLVSLESKMDTVIAQTSGKISANGGQPKPFQSAEANQPPRRDRVLYEAICADCHKVCEVPFKPSEDRAVYCKECFARRKSGANAKPYPVMTPVAMPQHMHKKPPAVVPVAAPVRETPKKAKKSSPVKKSKKKK